MSQSRILPALVMATVAVVTNVSAQTNAPLTRELATDLLNRHLARPHVTLLEFTKGGIERAEKEGIVQRVGSPAFPQWMFTPKGLRMVGAQLATNVIATPLGGGAGPRFQLREGLSESVAVVTGIADGPNPSFKQVEYKTAYYFPSEMSALSNYVYTAANARTNFIRYDDGWRVAPQ